MSYYYYPNNLYPAPNKVMNEANALCGNISAYQNSIGANLPFSYNGGVNLPFSNSIGCNNYNFSNNPFMNTSYNASYDKNGNILSSDFSQKTDLWAAGIGSLGAIANGFAAVKIAGINAETMKQREALQNSAFQQSSAYINQIQQQQMSQQNFESTMGMMMNFRMMEKMLEA